jgi:hypothetical protein
MGSTSDTATNPSVTALHPDTSTRTPSGRAPPTSQQSEANGEKTATRRERYATRVVVQGHHRSVPFRSSPPHPQCRTSSQPDPDTSAQRYPPPTRALPHRRSPHVKSHTAHAGTAGQRGSRNNPGGGRGRAPSTHARRGRLSRFLRACMPTGTVPLPGSPSPVSAAVPGASAARRHASRVPSFHHKQGPAVKRRIPPASFLAFAPRLV